MLASCSALFPCGNLFLQCQLQSRPHSLCFVHCRKTRLWEKIEAVLVCMKCVNEDMAVCAYCRRKGVLRDFSTLRSTSAAYCSLINKLYINASFFYANLGPKATCSIQRCQKALWRLDMHENKRKQNLEVLQALIHSLKRCHNHAVVFIREKNYINYIAYC